jgi:seryl-tRNA synthetase
MTLRADLIAAGHMLESAAQGVVAWSGTAQRAIDGLERLLDRESAAHGMEVIRFPPVMPRSMFEASGYMKGFPHLAGTIHSFAGDEAGHRALLRCMEAKEDWTAGQRATDVVMTPACCYPLYPLLARRGRLPPGGVTVDILSWVYRQEPSDDPARMRSFRLREFVRAGAAADIAAFRRFWMDRAMAIAATLGLDAALDVANDPFFGRPGKLRAGMQREEEAKFELLISTGRDTPTACASFNDAKDLFGGAFGLQQADGTPAQTGCVGFGMERMVLAMFHRHGMDVGAWPSGVRAALGLG